MEPVGLWRVICLLAYCWQAYGKPQGSIFDAIKRNESRNVEMNSSKWSLDPQHYLQNHIIADIHFIQKVHELSFELQQTSQILNIMVIGACDGTHDRLIYDLINPDNAHWRGILVEPLAHNFRDLTVNLRNVSHRIKTLQCAVTDQCVSEYVNMSYARVRPEVQDKYPHWFTREIASLDPNVTLLFEKFAHSPSKIKRIIKDAANGSSVDMKDFEWTTEAVKCMTGSVLISRMPASDWIHVIKIDAEGRDFLILLTLLKFFLRYRSRGDRTGVMRLPLLILIENKFLTNVQRARLAAATQQLGYESTLSYAPLGHAQHGLNANDALFFQPHWKL